MREGTARFAVTVGQNDKHLQKIIQKQLNNSGVSDENKYNFVSYQFFFCG